MTLRSITLVLLPWFALHGIPTRAAPLEQGRALQALASDDWISRAEALATLREQRNPAALPMLRGMLDDDREHPWVRSRALLAHADIEGGIDPGPFGKWVAHEAPLMRAAAAEVLEQHGGSSADAWIEILLGDDDPRVRTQAAASHARRKGAAGWPVVERVTAPGQSPPPRATARALAWVGTPPALQRLAAFAKQPDSRAELIRGIEDIPNPDLLPILLELQGAVVGDDLLTNAVRTAMQNHEWQHLVAALDHALKTGREELVRTVAQTIHHVARAPSLGPPLAAALVPAERVDTIKAGLTALAPSAMQPDRFRPVFQGFLGHEDPSVRVLAIRCLAHCDPALLYESLQPALTDPESRVTEAALETLKRTPPGTAPRGRLVSFLQAPLSHPDPAVRQSAYELLGMAGTQADFRPARAVLEPLLRGPDDALRLTAARALGALAPPDAVQDVVRAQGYLENWNVIGTFLNDDQNSAFDRVFPPEETIDFNASYKSEYVWLVEGQRRGENDQLIEREIRWSEAIVDETDGRLILSAHLPPPGSYAVGYAVADFQVDRAQDVLLHVDGDDAFRIWLNGELISEKAADFSSNEERVVRAKDVRAHLRKGPNRLLVKSANHQFQWWVRVRLTDQNLQPVPLSP